MDVVSLADTGLGNRTHVVDLGDGGALIIDPPRNPGPVLTVLSRRGLAPRFVAETHLHADFVSGAGELTALGAQLLAPAASQLAPPHRPLSDGEAVDLGGLRLEVIATPGHTPEHLAYLLHDDHRPVTLFSGGTLIVGGVARPDLISPEQTEPLARAAFRSLRERLFPLPDDLPVHPTHGAGSFCVTGGDDRASTTIGRERSSNPLLADDPDEDTFVARLLGALGSYPPYFLELRAVNRAGPPVYGPGGPPVAALSPGEVRKALARGAEVVDTRDVRAFAAGHVPGALANTWRPAFPTWLGWLVPRDRELVFITDADTDPVEVAWRAATVGFERTIGFLAGGMSRWHDAGLPVTSLPLLTAAEAAASPRCIVDVRQASEHAAGHVAGSIHRELGSLAADPAVHCDGPVLVHCGHNERAMTAASLLQRAGVIDVAVLDGGPADLVAAGLPLARTA